MPCHRSGPRRQRPQPVRSTALRLRVRGQIAHSVIEVIRSRYDQANFVSGGGGDTLLIVDDLDSSAERAMLNILWDAGHEVGTINSVR